MTSRAPFSLPHLSADEDDYVTMTDTHASRMLKDTALADDEYEFLKKRIKVIFKN